LTSTCCGSEAELISKRHIMIGDIDADETGYRCLNCGHKFYVWTKRNENKLEVHYAVDVKKP